MAELKDSGNRREFGTGAVRDICEGKGRCDLLPLEFIGGFLDSEAFWIFDKINLFYETGNRDYLKEACDVFITNHYPDYPTAILELAKHYEDGARKYSDRNWENGIPVHCFIDSGIRHLLKVYRGDDDEPHDRAFLWNMVGAAWTMKHHPELDDFTKNPPACVKTDTCPGGEESKVEKPVDLNIVKCENCSFATEFDDGQGYFKYRCNNEYGMNGCLQREDSYCSSGQKKGGTDD